MYIYRILLSLNSTTLSAEKYEWVILELNNNYVFPDSVPSVYTFPTVGGIFIVFLFLLITGLKHKWPSLWLDHFNFMQLDHIYSILFLLLP